MNKFLGIGNLTKDPECKTAGSSQVCKFSIAINDFYYADGAKKQNTTYLDIETWSKQAENCSKFLKKGSKVAIEGKLKMNNWEKDGKKYNRIFCLADRVHFLGSEEISNNSNTKSKEEVQEKVENEVDDIEDIDDIPF